MLTHFTVSSVLPRFVGSTEGMGLALTRAFEAPAAMSRADATGSVGALAAQNCIPSSIATRQPLAGAALLDILV
jgi:hypothetical protein